MSKRCCLLRWVGEETVSVVREDSAKCGVEIYVGALAQFKWLGKFYEAEVLKISSKFNYSRPPDSCAH